MLLTNALVSVTLFKKERERGTGRSVRHRVMGLRKCVEDAEDAVRRVTATKQVSSYT